MFLINASPENFVVPWNIPLEERLKALHKGQRRVAYFYEYPDSSTFRYRVYNMIQVLTESGLGISASFFCYDETNIWDKVVDIADIIVICRSRYNNRINRLITTARNKGKQVIFDIDDLVFNTAHVHIIINSMYDDVNPSEPWDYWFAYIGRLGETLSICDRAITTNAYLATRIEKFFMKQVSVIPNFINREQMEISKKLYQNKKSRGFERNNRIHLGYFSGSPTHNKDFDVISDALSNVLHRDPRVILRIVGYFNLTNELQNYRSRIELYPLMDFVNLQRVIGEVEVNLVPLQDNEFTNSKSQLKYFEAGITGTVTIASPVFSYVTAIRDGENGFIANSYEWYEKIVNLINTMDSYPTIAEEAFKDCEYNYSWQNQAGVIEKVLFPEAL